MDRLRVGDLRGRDDAADVQITLAAPRGPDADVLVGEAHVERVLIGLRVDGHRLHAELAAGVDDPQGDLAPVGDEDLLEHQEVSRILKRTSPYSTGCPLATGISRISPETSDSISFISFIASTMQRACPFFTIDPTST